ncbi:Na(+)/H(+) antiporter subunit C [Micromonospora robiginosa]|uniref:Na(+)/H(+) antiporter subunit C n=1 Tax=Micromonospora robiginosa TaxID=2749844 RepID=A0A7L6BDI7_9ACTN|nr:Na(+)/H(+) antiporter subunit C [Micromonospora ferruginea]QLQ39911.1 Na(+)/H(+) antiporter subunit C [Micromonospora ferruginea]
MTRGAAGPTLVLVLAVGVLVATGVTLLLERSLTRILLGVILLGNGVNLLILLGGRSGAAPLAGTAPAAEMSDALPQAMVLTAVVITFGLTAFLLAVAYRSWYTSGDDEVQDDLEDRQIVRLAGRDEVAAADLGGEGADDDREQVDPEPARRRLRRDGTS